MFATVTQARYKN